MKKNLKTMDLRFKPNQYGKLKLKKKKNSNQL
jgi:hypothetical protein